MSPNRLAITVGFRANGEAVNLFTGEPEGALDAFEKAVAGTDFVLVRAFRQLGMHTHPWKNARLGDFQEGFDASSTGVSAPVESTKIEVQTPEPLEAEDFEPALVADEADEEVDEAAELVGGATEAPAKPKAVKPKAVKK